MTKGKKRPSERKQIVAGYVPEHLATRFSLYTTLHNIPRAQIIEMIVIKIIEDAPSNDEMITGLMVGVAEEFKLRHRNTGEPWRKFAKKQREFLLKRKLPVEIVNEILSRAEQGVREMEKETDGTDHQTR